jgi:hypothetical protein
MKKIFILLLGILLLGLTSATYCYQESANVENQSGTDNCVGMNYEGSVTGNGDSDWYDGNWSTGDHYLSTTDHIMYSNYSLPKGFISAISTHKLLETTTYNDSIPSQCVIDDKIVIRVFEDCTYSIGSVCFSSEFLVDCWNGGDWYELDVYGSGIRDFAEEGLYLLIDSLPPTYSNNRVNATYAGNSSLFSLYVNDNLILENEGYFIFSTNNSGIWVNDSPINFTSTPSWANVTKNLNSTIGINIGYRWYLVDNMGNTNYTSIFSLITIQDSCVYSSGNWEINMSDNCVISENYDLGLNNITFVGTGNVTFNSTINVTNLEYPSTDQIIYIGGNAKINIG